MQLPGHRMGDPLCQPCSADDRQQHSLHGVLAQCACSSAILLVCTLRADKLCNRWPLALLRAFLHPQWPAEFFLGMQSSPATSTRDLCAS